MATGRDEIFRRFGPQLTEAVCLVLKDLLEPLYLEQGLSLPSDQELCSLLGDKLSGLQAYDWQEGQE